MFDLVQLITKNPTWAAAAMWAAMAALVAAGVAFLPELVDWLARDRYGRQRRDGAAPLVMHLAALMPLCLGAVDRLHAGMPRAWPFALAVAGWLAWVIGDVFRTYVMARDLTARVVIRRAGSHRDDAHHDVSHHDVSRRPGPRRYQPTGLPASS